MQKRLFYFFILIGTFLGAQTITPGLHSGSPYSVDCSTSASGTLAFSTSGTYNTGNLFKVEITDASGSYTTYPLYVGTLALSGVNPSGTINLGIYAGLPSGVSYNIRIVSTNPVVTSSSVGAFSITNSGGTCSNGKLIVNEMSQGATGGAFEYVELLVLGATPCSVVDIRNMIIDDNNGDFITSGPAAGFGIAGGHNRFTYSNQWSRLPSGTLILIYDNLNKNSSILLADDVTDANKDMVFVLPINGAATPSTGIEGTSTLPSTSSAAYSPVVYANASWSYMSLANAVDAIQTRYSNGNFMHGFSWGNAPMYAGPGFHMGTATTQAVVIYQNHSSGYTTSANYTRGAVPTYETPGINNNVNNMTFITSNTCIVLEEEGLVLDGENNENELHLIWNKTDENFEGSKFVIQYSSDAVEFSKMDEFFLNCDKNGKYHYYSKPENKSIYYKIQEEKTNGRILNSNILFLDKAGKSKFYYYGSSIYIPDVEEGSFLEVYQNNGVRCLSYKTEKNQKSLFLNNLPGGIYYARLLTKEAIHTFKFLHFN